MLKLLKVAKGIRALLDTVLVALPQVGNLGLLFFLLFFIFAALGVELFGRIGKSCDGLNHFIDYNTWNLITLAMLILVPGYRHIDKHLMHHEFNCNKFE